MFITRSITAGSTLVLIFAAQGSVRAQTTSPETADRATFEKAFKEADANHDGGLTREEIRKSRHPFPVIEKYFGAMDSDKDGKVTIAERDAWLAANKGKVAGKMEPDNQARKAEHREEKAEDRAAFEKAFKEADSNGDGGLTREEMRKSSHKFPVIEKFFAAMDTNNDAKVTIAERDAWLQANKGKVAGKMEK